MMNFLALTFLSLLTLASAQAKVSDACLNTEHWSLDSSTPNWMHEFQEFSTGRSSPVYGFAQAVQLKRMSQILTHADFEHDFSDYWIGRVLYELQLDPLAHQAMASVFENTENADLKKAAFSCLSRIQMRTPDWKAPSAQSIQSLALGEEDSDILFEISIGKQNSLIQKMASGHRGFLEGFQALSNKNYTDAILGFQAYFKYLETHSNPVLMRYTDQGHLYLGRAYYSVAKFPEAASEFQKVKKTSNQQIEAMSNLAWSYHLHEKYDDAIGVALQLRSGALRSTFAPEPLMVAAMGLNEVCNYPDSIRMIQAFTKDYQPAFTWLNAHPGSDDLYQLTVQALKGTPGVPTKISTEWIRSPEFLTRQKEMNALIETPKKINETGRSAMAEQARLTKAFVDQASQFLKDYRIAKLKLKPGEELASDFADRYQVLKKNMRKLSHFYRASKVFKNLAQNYLKRTPGMRQDLVKRVNADLQNKNRKMLTMLNKVKDNSDLIEVEIYNGASQDLVWKDAHPDFEKMSPGLEEQKAVADSAHTWNWGRFLASNIENSEVWEDELGALKADVTDQCGKKEKFLKLGVIKR